MTVWHARRVREGLVARAACPRARALLALTGAAEAALCAVALVLSRTGAGPLSLFLAWCASLAVALRCTRLTLVALGVERRRAPGSLAVLEPLRLQVEVAQLVALVGLVTFPLVAAIAQLVLPGLGASLARLAEVCANPFDPMAGWGLSGGGYAELALCCPVVACAGLLAVLVDRHALAHLVVTGEELDARISAAFASRVRRAVNVHALAHLWPFALAALTCALSPLAQGPASPDYAVACIRASVVALSWVAVQLVGLASTARSLYRCRARGAAWRSSPAVSHVEALVGQVLCALSCAALAAGLAAESAALVGLSVDQPSWPASVLWLAYAARALLPSLAWLSAAALWHARRVRAGLGSRSAYPGLRAPLALACLAVVPLCLASVATHADQGGPLSGGPLAAFGLPVVMVACTAVTLAAVWLANRNVPGRLPRLGGLVARPLLACAAGLLSLPALAISLLWPAPLPGPDALAADLMVTDGGALETRAVCKYVTQVDEEVVGHKTVAELRGEDAADRAAAACGVLLVALVDRRVLDRVGRTRAATARSAGAGAATAAT